MRQFTSLSANPDLWTLAAVAGLAAMVYFCSLPSTFPSLSHRHAGAAEMMDEARERIVKEGSLFFELVRAPDDLAAAKLREQLVENERAFHDAASGFAAEWPKDGSEIDSLVSRFDHLAATGWQAAAIAPQSSPDSRLDLLAGDFSKTLGELREESQKIAPR